MRARAMRARGPAGAVAPERATLQPCAVGIHGARAAIIPPDVDTHDTARHRGVRGAASAARRFRERLDAAAQMQMPVQALRELQGLDACRSHVQAAPGGEGVTKCACAHAGKQELYNLRSVYGQRKRALEFCNSTFTTIGEKKFCILHLLEDVKVRATRH